MPDLSDQIRTRVAKLMLATMADPGRHRIARIAPGVWIHIWPAEPGATPEATRCRSWTEAMIEVAN